MAFIKIASLMSAFVQLAGMNNFLLYAIVVFIIIIFLGGLTLVAGNMIPIHSAKSDVNGANDRSKGSDFGFFEPKKPSFVNGDAYHSLKAGHDILLEGGAETRTVAKDVKRFALQPRNHRGMAPIPKLMVEVGDSVKAGDPILFDKRHPEILHTAPVSGEFIELIRGAKRAITEVVFLADKEQRFKTFHIPDLATADRQEIVDLLLESGFWTSILSRPFGIIADPTVTPRDIFISTFDSAPLAPDYDYIVTGREQEFQEGLNVLNHLTDGKVYLGLRAAGNLPSPAFKNAENVEKHWFKGKHPFGNVGVQIHHIKPINSGETVWTLKVQDVITLGQLFLSSCYYPERMIAIAGAEIADNHYVRTMQGANIGELLADSNLNPGSRVISGDALSGEAKHLVDFISEQDDQISTLAEGDYYETFGWLWPQAARPTVSRTYPTGLFKDLTFKADTNTHGEKRAFVMTGQYESVLPMDIHVQQLMKNILCDDIERMEGLGILELLEEDVALCEFSCTSKMPLQKMLRDGLTNLQEQG